MKVQSTPTVKVDEERQGEAITVGGLILEPVARVRGRIWTPAAEGQEGTGQGVAAFVQVTPKRVTVRGGPGGDLEIPIIDPTRESLRGIGLGMLLVAGICLLLIIARGLYGRKGSHQED